MSKRKPQAMVQPKVRIREALRAQLEEAAKRKGTSLNAEITERLERSLERENLIIDAMTLKFSRQGTNILLAVGEAMLGAAFRQMPAVHQRMLAALSTKGTPVEEAPMAESWAKHPESLQAALLAGIAMLSMFLPYPPQQTALTSQNKQKAVEEAEHVVRWMLRNGGGTGDERHFGTGTNVYRQVTRLTVREVAEALEAISEALREKGGERKP